MTDIAQLLPLTPAVFYILLALATGDKHGYEIMKTVRRDSNGTVKMGNGTLYGSLKRMLADGLIEEAEERTDQDETRRKYYRMTDRGRKAMHAEIQRYRDTVNVINNYKLVPNLRPGDSLP